MKLRMKQCVWKARVTVSPDSRLIVVLYPVREKQSTLFMKRHFDITEWDRAIAFANSRVRRANDIVTTNGKVKP